MTFYMKKREFVCGGGDVCLNLIKNTVLNIFIYFMSLFHIPWLLREKLEQTQRDLPLGDGGLTKKINFLKWFPIHIDKK